MNDLTREDILALEVGPEADALVAEHVAPQTMPVSTWAPTIKLHHARLVEDEMERRELSRRYVRMLTSVIFDDDDPSTSEMTVDANEFAWGLRRATPLQIVKAALLTVLEMEGMDDA